MNSYAKINLTLDILGKRKDGYHNLSTVYQQVELHDDISLERADRIILECGIKFLETRKNLCFRAAAILKDRYGVSDGVRIQIKKVIPVGAGLGGGSSNAAAVLKGLNALWNLNLPEKELMSLGKEIGMDVPFAIVGGTARGEGRGEEITKLPPLKKYHVVIVFPGFSISTKDSYGSLDCQKIGKAQSTEKFIAGYDLKFLHNDFEFSIFKAFPKLKEIKKALGPHSLLSGSGSCIYGLFEKRADAEKKFEEMKKEFPQTFLTETV